nr:hypothetical protein [Tanacetum cinerariifolium]
MALYCYPLDSGDDLSDEDLSKTTESLHIQTASTSVVHPPHNRPLPTSPTFACRPGKEIPMPLGYRQPWIDEEMHHHPPRSRSPSPSLPPLVSPSPPLELVPPPLEHVESLGDNIKTLRVSLEYAIKETMTLRARVRLLKQHDVITRDSLRIARVPIACHDYTLDEISLYVIFLVNLKNNVNCKSMDAFRGNREDVNAIEIIAIYETKTRMARDSMDQVER